MSERVAIVGSRKFPELERVREYVRQLPRDTVIVTGSDPDDKEDRKKWGVDETAVDEARRLGMPAPLILKPDYAQHGKIAPLLRNKDIVQAAARVAAFWDGKSNGTRNALEHARRLSRPVEVFSPTPKEDDGQQPQLFNPADFVQQTPSKPPPGKPADWWTLAQVKEYARALAEKGVQCPCCKQRIKIYTRKLNATMAHVAILIWKRQGRGEKFFHLPTFIRDSGLQPTVYGDTTKLVHWQVLEARRGKSTGGGPHGGWYRLTELGARFVRNEVALPRTIRIYNDRLLKPKVMPTMVRVREALEDKFDYTELMRG